MGGDIPHRLIVAVTRAVVGHVGEDVPRVVDNPEAKRAPSFVGDFSRRQVVALDLVRPFVERLETPCSPQLIRLDRKVRWSDNPGEK